jgi:hypothetical protein
MAVHGVSGTPKSPWQRMALFVTSIHTNKQVAVCDWRLGILYHSLNLLVGLYVLFNLGCVLASTAAPAPSINTGVHYPPHASASRSLACR